MYLQRVEEITPNISYCAYNLKEGSTDINDLMQLRLSATAVGGTHDPVLTAKIDVSFRKCIKECVVKVNFSLKFSNP